MNHNKENCKPALSEGKKLAGRMPVARKINHDHKKQWLSFLLGTKKKKKKHPSVTGDVVASLESSLQELQLTSHS